MAVRLWSSIRAKLLVAYVVPTALLLGAFGWAVFRLERRNLEGELAARLEAIAGAAAEQVRGENVIGLTVHDEETELYGILARKLQLLEARIGADRISVCDLDRKSLVDSEPGVAVGEPCYQLEASRTEIDHMLADGRPRTSVLFRGKDGRLYKSGFAVVRLSPDDPTVVAVLGVDANARFFGRLSALRQWLLITGGAILLLVIAASLVIGSVITRPLLRVAREAQRIGAGDLATPVEPGPHDEVGVLAATLEEMRQQIRARDERMQMMLAGIAHEVRNPLAGIELFAGILREELEGEPARQGHVAKIDRELRHLKAVVSDFLEYARRPHPELGDADLGDILSDAAEVVAPEAEAAGVALEVTRGAATPVRADREQLRRALLNLLKNAVQATPKGGRVSASTAPAVMDGQPHMRLSIADTGRGIAADSLNRIFTPFFTTKEKGTGLGLAFAKEIVEAHGGSLDVVSQEGSGTTFTLLLPPRAG